MEIEIRNIFAKTKKNSEFVVKILRLTKKSAKIASLIKQTFRP